MGAPQWPATGAGGDAHGALRDHLARGSFRGRSQTGSKSWCTCHQQIFPD